MTLAIFDLDNTLLAGDSDHAWGEFLMQIGAVNADYYRLKNNEFYLAYQNGTLDISEYLEFSLAPLAENPIDTLLSWQQQFLNQVIKPWVKIDALNLVKHHQQQGHTCLIITATNNFITAPIAKLFNIDILLATQAEKIDNQFTGKVSGTPCFQAGKIIKLNDWLSGKDHTLEGSYFYSDSHNDIPLLSKVCHPVAVDPDDKLRQHAIAFQWKILPLHL